MSVYAAMVFACCVTFYRRDHLLAAKKKKHEDKEVSAAALTATLSSKSTKNIRSLLTAKGNRLDSGHLTMIQRFRESVPQIFNFSLLYRVRMAREFVVYHRWLTVLFHDVRGYSRVYRIGALACQMLYATFIQTVIHTLTNLDDHTCGLNSNERACLSRPSQYIAHQTECYWIHSNQSCHFRQPRESMQSVILITIVSALISIPFARLVEYLLIKVSVPTSVYKIHDVSSHLHSPTKDKPHDTGSPTSASRWTNLMSPRHNPNRVIVVHSSHVDGSKSEKFQYPSTPMQLQHNKRPTSKSRRAKSTPRRSPKSPLSLVSGDRVMNIDTSAQWAATELNAMLIGVKRHLESLDVLGLSSNNAKGDIMGEFVPVYDYVFVTLLETCAYSGF